MMQLVSIIYQLHANAYTSWCPNLIGIIAYK